MQTPKTLVGIGGQPPRDNIVRAIASHVELRGFITGPTAIEQLDTDVDLIIVDLPVLRAIARHYRGRRKAHRSGAPTIILTLADDEFGDALGLLEHCQSFLFWQHATNMLDGLIALAREGYCSVPSSFLPDLLSDRVRIGRVTRLTDIERQVFRLLGEAKSNRAIAAELAVPEPVAKSLVRAVLAKLRLKNRTEAAVFATRFVEAEPGSTASDFSDTSPKPLAS